MDIRGGRFDGRGGHQHCHSWHSGPVAFRAALGQPPPRLGSEGLDCHPTATTKLGGQLLLRHALPTASFGLGEAPGSGCGGSEVWNHGGMATAPPVVPPPKEIHRAFKEELSPGHQSVVLSWLSFTVTFVVIRLITHRIRANKAKQGAKGPESQHHGGLHDISIKGVHLHHYLWGILVVSTVAGLSLRVEEHIRRHPLMATAYGIGMSLIVDEFALLLDLEDVYWAKQGRTSVDVAVTLSAGAGTALAAGPVLRRLRHDRQRPVDAH